MRMAGTDPRASGRVALERPEDLHVMMGAGERETIEDEVLVVKSIAREDCPAAADLNHGDKFCIGGGAG